jgi:hypothetical protein
MVGDLGQTPDEAIVPDQPGGVDGSWLEPVADNKGISNKVSDEIALRCACPTSGDLGRLKA